TPAPPELLAWHQQEGGDAVAAVRSWQAAGNHAMARSAVREAITHFELALALIERARSLEPDCDAIELEVRASLGDQLFQAEGFTSRRVYLNFTRALELATSLARLEERLRVSGAIAASLGA